MVTVGARCYCQIDSPPVHRNGKHEPLVKKGNDVEVLFP